MRRLLRFGVVVLLFSACSTEQDSLQQERDSGGTVTFEEFKSATGLQSFGPTISIPKKASGAAARPATMEDFIVDTQFIRQTIIDQKITYSFSIEPKVIKDGKTLYNLIVYHNNGDWQYAIMEMKPTAAKFQNLVLGQQVKLDGEIAEIYHTDVARGADCYMFSIESHHCTHTGQCASGVCDGCGLCVDYINFKVCRHDTEDFNTATLIATDNDYGSGGGNVVHDDFVFVPNFGPGNIRAIRTERAALFFEALDAGQQAWAEGHGDAYHEVVEYFLDHYNMEDTQAIEMINAGMDGSAILLKPFFKYPPGSNYETIYPELTYLVKEFVPTQKDDQNLIDIIHDLTTVSINDIKKDMEWGFGAEINVIQLGVDENGYQYKGKFNPNEPDKIYIDIDLVQQLEILPEGEAKGNIRRLITFSVLLHELVHYEDYNADQIMSSDELGDIFEAILGEGWVMEFEVDANGQETNKIIWVKVN